MRKAGPRDGELALAGLEGRHSLGFSSTGGIKQRAYAAGDNTLPQTVLTVISTLDRRGPVNVMKSIVEHYDGSRYRPVIATLSQERDTSRIADFQRMGIRMEQLQLTRIGSLISGMRRLREVANSVGADIVHCHCLRPDVLAAYAGLNCMKVSTVHSDLESDYRNSHGTLQGTIMANRQYAALRRFDAVAAVSETAAQSAAEFGLRPEVIPSGVDLRTYVPTSNPEETRSTRKRLAWPEDRLVILHAGALRGLKRPVEAIAAFRDSAAPNNSLLVFAGDGPLLEQCKQTAKGCRNIIFLGHRSDLPELLSAADAVVSNSTSEGLPMALLEACACGLRVIASDIEPHRYIATLFPEQVSLFPSGDNGALTDLLNALAVRRRRNPIHPPAGSLEAISAKTMSRRYQDLYDRVLSRTQTVTHN